MSVNDAFHTAADEPRFDGIFAVTDAPMVSADIIGRPQSCFFLAGDTMTSGARMNVLGWYDNGATPTGCSSWRPCGRMRRGR